MFIRTVILMNLLIAHCDIVLSMQSEFCFPTRLDQPHLGNNNFVKNEGESFPQHIVLKISAFDQDFLLDLHPDSSFIGPTVSAQSDAESAELSRCFYAGHVNSERYSYAALSICNGLHGAFGYNGWEYFIKPAMNDTSTGIYWKDERAHVIRRRTNANLSSNSTSRCAVDSVLNQDATQSLEKYKHLKDLNAHNMTETVLKSRSKRFASIPRYVETLVVADESMAKFHGDDLKHYLLTLMSVAARLYKHPSILNSISIVVVKFMVINEADKGPKVSGNAAMTLRNFCTWQKKLNKNNDKNPDYWDTAILFTKQVRYPHSSIRGALLLRGFMA